jgi:hypothetical protein
MPTIANLPSADVEVTFPSGNVKNVNMIRLLVQAQNAEFKTKHGMFLPNVAKLHPTVKALREEYWSGIGPTSSDLRPSAMTSWPGSTAARCPRREPRRGARLTASS